MDKGQLNQILGAVGQGESEPSIAISFEVADTAALRQQALQNAVNEAKHNAETLAAAAGVTLQAIRSIEYGWTEVQLSVARYMLPQAAHAGTARAPDLEPQDVEAAESVTITWEIA
jgi:hypothetical protein